LLTSAGAAATYGARVTDVVLKVSVVAVLTIKSTHAPLALVWKPSATCCGPELEARREKLTLVGVYPTVLTQNCQPTDALLTFVVGHPVIEAAEPETPAV